MDFGDIGERLPLIVGIIIFILLQFFLKRKQPTERTPLPVVHSLLLEVKQNQQLAEAFRFQWRTRKFALASWQRNKAKLDFLDSSLQVTLADAFTMVADFNQQIEAAKKYKSTSYMASINVIKLKELLARSEQRLEQWLASEAAIPGTPPKSPSMFGGLFGGR